MNNIDFDRISKRQQFYIPNVTVDNAWLEFYTNYNWGRRTPPNRRDKYPNEQLQRLAFDVTIPKMVVKHADMNFRIVADKSDKEAFFSYNDVYSVTTNITNNTAAKNANPYSRVSSTCKVLNTGPMKSELVLNLKDKNAPFSLTSTLGAMDATAYNVLSEGLGMMQVKSGKINKMILTMEGDEYKAKGNIDFYYQGMKYRMLKKDDDDNKLKNRTLVSLMTNIMLPNDNPKKNGKFRKGPINIIRDEQESFFGFIWRGMLDGMTSAMTGFDQEKDKPENKVIKLGKIFAGPENGPEEKSAGGDKKRLKKLKGKE